MGRRAQGRSSRNHIRSAGIRSDRPSPDGDYTIPAYVLFIGALLDKVGIEQCVLGGNSLGGNIAQIAIASLAIPSALRNGHRYRL
jgi:pimeloyl-ACP methyl ester carboxylesterase